MDLLEQGARMRAERTSRFCGGLLDLWPGTSPKPPASSPPTTAPSALRFVVLLRKRSGGTRADHGDRFIERRSTGTSLLPAGP